MNIRNHYLAIILSAITFLVIALIELRIELIRVVFYDFWAIFYKQPLIILLTLILSLIAIYIIIFILLYKTYRKTNYDKIDKILTLFIYSIFLILYLFLRLLHLLNYSVFSLISLLRPISTPPIIITNPIIGIIAMILIIFKGYLIRNMLIKWELIFVENICLIFILGFGITSFQITILSLTHILYFKYVLITDIITISILTILNAFLNRFSLSFTRRATLSLNISMLNRSLSKNIIRLDSYTFIILIFLGIEFIMSSYYALSAIVEWDSLAYIAHYAKIIYEHHGLLDIHGPSIGLEMSASYPIGFQALAIYFYEYVGESNDFYMRVLSPIFLILTLLSAYLFSAEILHNTRERLLTVFTVSSIPLLLYYYTFSGHYMSYLVFSMTMSLYYLIKFVKKYEITFLRVATILCGFTSLISYFGLTCLLFLVMSLALRRLNMPNVIKLLPIYFMFPLPYLIRNFVVTGDPVFPMISDALEKNDILVESRRVHFSAQTVFAGVKLDDPFSLIDFTMLRPFSLNPIFIIDIILLPVLLYLRRKYRKFSYDEIWLFSTYVMALTIFLLMPTFERYALPFTIIYATVYVWLVSTARELNLKKLQYTLMLILALSFAITLGAVIAGFKTTPTDAAVSDVMDYLRYYYPDDVEVWKWINENINKSVKIASYDIRYYYINTEIIPLDGALSYPLYQPNITVKQALEYLRNLDVYYIYSTRWASRASPITPPAYYWNIITKYLGHYQYFPPVYVAGCSAIYHVGPLNTSQLINEHLAKSAIPPIINVSITISVKEPASFKLDIPCDYHKAVTLYIETKPNALIAIKGVNKPLTINADTHLEWLVEEGKYMLTITPLNNNSIITITFMTDKN